ncbi:DUF3352 domain-containing protein [Nocardioides mangrovi]|uniref:DUF3352 domain-containing protein n=1 Tax=Nocardioides mangrovi TaxID=2874580 RepID=A0ABS7U7H4_9ACTN|nr:DUF3352 domain-containing protein [Nocardioides mangrovi]MBZ5736830.1 DUF3352 domain-containing protein [Nocardioides mangrovi]
MTDQPEYLDSRGGAPGVPPTERRPRRRRRPLLIAAGVVGLAVVGGGAWAAWSFFSSGAQPSEALPASTIAYVSVDLDPSGGQKIEALRTLKKFPALDDQLDLGTDDDLREWIFDKIQEESSECTDLDYGDDVEPWLGDRFAVAAVDSGGDSPSPIVVVQVSDDDKADAGLTKLRDCGGGSTEDGAWAIDDGWALIGEDQQTVDAVAAEAAQGSLADDADFQQWTGAAGDDGIVSMYAAPTAGQALADYVSDSFGELTGADPSLQSQMDQATEQLKDFKGAAATVRFDDGGLELEAAADAGSKGAIYTASDDGGEAVTSLPSGTAAAFGVGLDFQDGWLDRLLDPIAQEAGVSSDDLVATAQEELGIDLPQDVETLLGHSFAIAIDQDFDPSALDSASGPQDVTGVGVKILGDADAIDGVLDKVRTAAGGADAGLLDSDPGDGAVAVGPDPDYRRQLLEDGDLGDDDGFRKVVEHGDDASEILYVDVDAVTGWLSDSGAFGDDPDVADNLEPLAALGLSAWQEDDVSHVVLKVTTG